MAAGKRPLLPMILSANALLDGAVVYRAAFGWSPRLAEARVARDDEEARLLEIALEAAERTETVVEPVLVAIEIDAEGRVVPCHYRDRIRALGPTVRPDLGPQGRGEHGHVSL